jgi:MFS family permease
MTASSLSPFSRFSLSGLAANFIGNGIGRFAYIALMPALIGGGWFTKGEASYLGVATLAGYLLGAPMTNYLVRHIAVKQLLRAAMLFCSFSYLACAWPHLPLLWYFFWRTLAGCGGALLMVLAAPLVLQQHASALRGRVSGIVFAGIGLGAMASGTLVPLLVWHGLTTAWLGMGVLCLLLTAASWRVWGQAHSAPPGHAASTDSAPMSKATRTVVGLILLSYTMNAIGYLPHTLFWVDFIVRELHMSLASGGFFWAMFGLGAALGPPLTGWLGDHFGFRRCLIIGFILKAVGVALPLFSQTPLALFISSLLVGLFTPGIVTLVSTYTLDCVGAAHHRKAWSMMTTSFAASQAIVGYLMAAAIANAHSYRPLFMVSAAALLVSVLCIVAIRPQAAKIAA